MRSYVTVAKTQMFHNYQYNANKLFVITNNRSCMVAELFHFGAIYGHKFESNMTQYSSKNNYFKTDD